MEKYPDHRQGWKGDWMGWVQLRDAAFSVRRKSFIIIIYGVTRRHTFKSKQATEHSWQFLPRKVSKQGRRNTTLQFVYQSLLQKSIISSNNWNVCLARLHPLSKFHVPWKKMSKKYYCKSSIRKTNGSYANMCFISTQKIVGIFQEDQAQAKRNKHYSNTAFIMQP